MRPAEPTAEQPAPPPSESPSNSPLSCDSAGRSAVNGKRRSQDLGGPNWRQKGNEGTWVRGAKPSSGLVHLHKSFIELHFAGQALPQNVRVQACIDGRQLGTQLPGQVYSTSCGQDHWLLGLQYVFKAYREPLITGVDMGQDNLVLVCITSKGILDKYTSKDPTRRAELHRSFEMAAYKFAQTAVMKKDGHQQITGPNINIPKKQLRAQWKELLELLQPQDVTAHIYLDDSPSYISCSAKVILTKAKAEPVFYLSGLSALLKNYTGAYASLQLCPADRLVKVNLDTSLVNVPLDSTTITADMSMATASSLGAAHAATASAAGGGAANRAGGGSSMAPAAPASAAAAGVGPVGGMSAVAPRGGGTLPQQQQQQQQQPSKGSRAQHQPASSATTGEPISPGHRGGSGVQMQPKQQEQQQQQQETSAQRAYGNGFTPIAVAAAAAVVSAGAGFLDSSNCGWPQAPAPSCSFLELQWQHNGHMLQRSPAVGLSRITEGMAVSSASMGLPPGGVFSGVQGARAGGMNMQSWQQADVGPREAADQGQKNMHLQQQQQHVQGTALAAVGGSAEEAGGGAAAAAAALSLMAAAGRGAPGGAGGSGHSQQAGYPSSAGRAAGGCELGHPGVLDREGRNAVVTTDSLYPWMQQQEQQQQQLYRHHQQQQRAQPSGLSISTGTPGDAWCLERVGSRGSTPPGVATPSTLVLPPQLFRPASVTTAVTAVAAGPASSPYFKEGGACSVVGSGQAIPTPRQGLSSRGGHSAAREEQGATEGFRDGGGRGEAVRLDVQDEVASGVSRQETTAAAAHNGVESLLAASEATQGGLELLAHHATAAMEVSSSVGEGSLREKKRPLKKRRLSGTRQSFRGGGGAGGRGNQRQHWGRSLELSETEMQNDVEMEEVAGEAGWLASEGQQQPQKGVTELQQPQEHREEDEGEEMLSRALEAPQAPEPGAADSGAPRCKAAAAATPTVVGRPPGSSSKNTSSGRAAVGDGGEGRDVAVVCHAEGARASKGHGDQLQESQAGVPAASVGNAATGTVLACRLAAAAAAGASTASDSVARLSTKNAGGSGHLSSSRCETAAPLPSTPVCSALLAASGDDSSAVAVVQRLNPPVVGNLGGVKQEALLQPLAVIPAALAGNYHQFHWQQPQQSAQQHVDSREVPEAPDAAAAAATALTVVVTGGDGQAQQQLASHSGQLTHYAQGQQLQTVQSFQVSSLPRSSVHAGARGWTTSVAVGRQEGGLLDVQQSTSATKGSIASSLSGAAAVGAIPGYPVSMPAAPYTAAAARSTYGTGMPSAAAASWAGWSVGSLASLPGAEVQHGPLTPIGSAQQIAPLQLQRSGVSLDLGPRYVAVAAGYDGRYQAAWQRGDQVQPTSWQHQHQHHHYQQQQAQWSGYHQARGRIGVTLPSHHLETGSLGLPHSDAAGLGAVDVSRSSKLSPQLVNFACKEQGQPQLPEPPRQQLHPEQQHDHHNHQQQQQLLGKFGWNTNNRSPGESQSAMTAAAADAGLNRPAAGATADAAVTQRMAPCPGDAEACLSPVSRMRGCQIKPDGEGGAAAAAAGGVGGSVSDAAGEDEEGAAGAGGASPIVVDAAGWPLLPDARSLLDVGRALVQVLNFLDASGPTRLSLTKTIRNMSSEDREWLVSIIYPHLQDACSRHALKELKMALNEIAGAPCFEIGEEGHH